MASALRQGSTKFSMRKDAERAAIRALRDAHAQTSGGAFAVGKEELERAKTLDETFLLLGWRIVRGGDGDVRGIVLVAKEYAGNEEPMFEALAPCVEPGSVVEVWHDETPKRFKFTGRTLVERRIKPAEFSDFEEEEEAAPVSRIPVFADVVKTAPPVGERRRYAPTESFTPGEWIEHVKFGPGLVMRNAEPGKVRALFQDGERVLVAK